MGLKKLNGWQREQRENEREGEWEFELLAAYWIRCDGDFWLELGKRKQFKHTEWGFLTLKWVASPF